MLSNLQVGDIVKTKDNKYGIVMGSYIMWDVFTTDIKDYYTEDLVHTGREELSIVEIYREPVKGRMNMGDLRGLIFGYDTAIPNKVELVYPAKPTVNWNAVEKWTKVQVRDSEDEEWLNRYLIKYTPCEQYSFYASSRSEFALGKEADSYGGIGYKMCRLYEEDK